MTHGQQRRRWLATGAACLVLASTASGDQHEKGEHAAHGGATVIQVLSTNIQGKNVFIPSTIVVQEGVPHVLSIFNTTDTPHGFKIEGLGIEFVLPVKEEFEVKLPALKGEGIYKVECQLHPPHRSAQLVVLDAD